MTSTTQISAHIPLVLKERMERYVRTHGLTRAHLIEEALEHHLRALDELPPDAVVPARLVLSRDSAERVAELLRHPPAPTDEMRALFSDR